MHKEKQHKIYVPESLYGALKKRLEGEFKDSYIKPSMNAFLITILSDFMNGKVIRKRADMEVIEGLVADKHKQKDKHDTTRSI